MSKTSENTERSRGERDDEEMMTRAELLSRGWTEAAIRRFLGDADELRRNPRYRSAAPMRLYRAVRVQAAEQTGAFSAFREASRRRSASATKASDTRRAQLLTAIEAWEPQVSKKRYELVRRLAIEAYNERARLDACLATERSDPEFLERITLNFIRHELTDYEAKLGELRGKPGVREAYERGRARLAERILEAYPALRAAHARQEAYRAARALDVAEAALATKPGVDG